MTISEFFAVTVSFCVDAFAGWVVTEADDFVSDAGVDVGFAVFSGVVNGAGAFPFILEVVAGAVILAGEGWTFVDGWEKELVFVMVISLSCKKPKI